MYIYIYTWYIYIYTVYIYICDHPTVRLLMMGAYRHQHASLLLIMASAKKDVPMAEDMSRYAQYLQQPARCATFQGFENFPQLTVIKDFWKQKFPPHLLRFFFVLRCARYLEPVILALSRIWTEMDSMREHRLLRFKLLRQAAKTNWNKPKVDRQLKRIQRVLDISSYSLGDIVFGYLMLFRGSLWILRCLNRWTRPMMYLWILLKLIRLALRSNPSRNHHRQSYN